MNTSDLTDSQRIDFLAMLPESGIALEASESIMLQECWHLHEFNDGQRIAINMMVEKYADKIGYKP